MKNKKSDSIDKLIHKEILGRYVDSYLPWYDEYSDYNTNAKSYYDYLARYNKILKVLTDLVNMLLARDIDVVDTDTIKFTKIGQWISENECESIDDIIKLMADVKISDEKKEIEVDGEKYNLENSIEVIGNTGIYSPDYLEIINDLKKYINELLEYIEKLENEQENIINKNDELKESIQKIVNNLFESGAITNNNIYNFEFKENRKIASGNINLFGGVQDGKYYIKTSDSENENDITAGVEE